MLHTYNRAPVAFVRGEGMHLYDAEGKEYLDMAAGIAVHALGHSHPVLTKALKEQVDTLIHISNLYYHDQLAAAAEKLTRVSRMNKVFFTNSGTEAIEGAIKAARKYAWLKDGKNDHEIIAMWDSFHGRSLGALSVTGNTHYQEAFRPLIGGIRFATLNDLESVASQVNDRTCAVILETVQGEGGIHPVEPAFLRGIRKICDEHDILLILDEIQCGMGRCSIPLGADGKPDRTGKTDGSLWYAWQAYGVEPDILASAKALGCGVPVGAFLLNEKTAAQSLVPGDHGTTYGGNPLACRAVSTVLDIYEQEHIIEHVQAVTPYFEEKLDELVREIPCLKTRRGMGFLQGLVVQQPEGSEDPCPTIGDIIGHALEQGLLIISAGSDVLRLAPPLIATEADIDRACEILKRSIISQRLVTVW